MKLVAADNYGIKRSVFTAVFGVLALLCVPHCYGDNLFPDIPKKDLPLVKTVPTKGEIVLETRSFVLSGDPVYKDGKIEIEVAIFGLEDKSEKIWDISPDIERSVDISNEYSNNRASWASIRRQFFLANDHAAFLINEDGSYLKLNLKMPGQLKPLDGMRDFAITNDGQRIAYGLYTRDEADITSDLLDPVAIKFGKFYRNLMYQEISGSDPISIAGGQAIYLGSYVVRPAWSPDGTKIAYVDKSNSLVVTDLKGSILLSVGPFQSTQVIKSILEVKWSPDGKELGFVIDEFQYKDQSKNRTTLYTMDVNGHDLKPFSIGKNNINISTFAWSPSGKKIVFRSNYKKKEICNFNAMFLMQTGHLPCRKGEYLFTSNTDGSDLKRISEEPDFRRSQLFWIR